MSYDNNDLGYDLGYDSDWVQRVIPVSTINPPQQTSSRNYSLDPSTAAAFGSPVKGAYSLHMPGGDGEPGQKVKVMNAKGETKEVDNKDLAKAKSEGFEPFQVKMHGKVKENGDSGKDTFLVQYFDAKGNPIKHDEVTGKQAKELGIPASDLETAGKADSITKDKNSFFAKQASELKAKEGAKSPTDINLPTDVEATNAGKIGAEADDARWNSGGAYHKRLTEQYGMTDNEVKFVRKEFGGDVDKKFPEMDADQKKSQKAQGEFAQGKKKEAMESIMKDRASKLESNVNSKKAKDDPTRIDGTKARALTEQEYRNAGFNVDQQEPKDWSKFVTSQDAVDKSIGEYSKTSTAKGVDPSVTVANNKAYQQEKDALVDQVVTQMPDKVTKKVNGQDKEVKLSKEEKYAHAVAYVQHLEDTHKFEGPNGEKSPEAVKKYREEFAAKSIQDPKDKKKPTQATNELSTWAVGMHNSPSADDKFSDLVQRGGIKEDPTAGLTKKQKEDFAAKKADAGLARENEMAKKKDEAQALGIDTSKEGWLAEYEKKKLDLQTESRDRAEASAAGVEYKPGWKLAAKEKDKAMDHEWSVKFAAEQGRIQRANQSIGNMENFNFQRVQKMEDRPHEALAKGMEALLNASHQLLIAFNNMITGMLGAAKK